MRRFAREWVERYPSIAALYRAIAGPRRVGSEGAAENYIKAVRKFVVYLGLSDPEYALKRLRDGEIDANKGVDGFIDAMLEKYAHTTVRTFVFGVKKWLELNDVKVDWNKIQLPTSAAIVESDRAPTREELKTLLTHASSSRDRATILILASSGLRIGTLLSLKVGDILWDFPDVACIKVERQRGRKFVGKRGVAQGKVYYTFITPEAREELKKYLEERKRAGEKISDESPLIGDVYHRGKSINVLDFERVWARLLRRAGLAEKSNRWYKLHIHTLRKFFRSNCIGVDPSYREHWMGHKGGYLDESYFKAEIDKHLAEYRKAIPHLTIISTPLEEKQLRVKAILDFARLQGFEEEKLQKLEEILARAKDIDEGIREFRRLQEMENNTYHNGGTSMYVVAKGEKQLLSMLQKGYKLIQPLNHDKYLLKQK
ncbi:MAG: tyrosine-type recombinase/integrase [Candidatus Bathyarchaeales archaeon]